MRLDDLRGGLIVSVQAREGSVLGAPETIATLAACAEANGAVGVRIEGVARIAATRARVPIPIVGLIKRRGKPEDPYITPQIRDVEAILGAGADIVAFDGTRRTRPDGSETSAYVEVIHHAGALAMADCAEIDDARAARAAGCDIVASTLCGYTPATGGTSLPALDLVAAMRAEGGFVIAEGGIATPEDAARAFASGADAIVVGTALTDLDTLIERFVARTPRAS